MKIISRLQEKKDLYGGRPVTIAFLGDSVTQGCFECYKTGETSLETVFDYPSAYSTRLREILNLLYPRVQINIINSGISGDWAENGKARIERDIAPYHPDLTVVSYGLNDSTRGLEYSDNFAAALRGIFKEIKDLGSEIIFLTQNFMNTEVSCHLQDPFFRQLAESFSKVQREGILGKYFERARQVCTEEGVPICDLYSVWEKWAAGGVETTELLANHFNHPIRQYHYYIAVKLMEKMFDL